MDNKGVKNLMIANYGKECWLHYKLTRENPLTFHHIKPKRDGGKATEENGALLSRYAHDDFNILENMYPELAKEINEYLLIYKGDYPIEVEERIIRLLELVRLESNRKVIEMEYTYNKETDGICTLAEFASHGAEGCLRCPKKGKCDEVAEEYAREKSEKNALSNANQKGEEDREQQRDRDTEAKQISK